MIVNTAADSPNTFGPYRVLERIGEGGMSVVYLTLRTGDDLPQTVKVLHEAMAQNHIVSRRFLREAQVASTLNHPRIVPITGAGQEDGRFYLAMEYVRGVELEQIFHACLRSGRPIPPPVTLSLAADVLAALQYAHTFQDSDGRHLGIVHRDLSPRNVLVTNEGRASVIDFGLARTNLGSFRTQPGMVMGTFRYMSPEQAVAEPADHRSDLYTFAVVLYELLTNSLVVPDVATKDILHHVVAHTPEPASTRNPALPGPLNDVLRRAMEKLPDDRYASAEAFAEDLREAGAVWAACPHAEVARFARSILPEKFDASELRYARAIAEAQRAAANLVGTPEFEATRAGPALATAPEPPPNQTVEAPAVGQEPGHGARVLAPLPSRSSRFRRAPGRRTGRTGAVAAVGFATACVAILLAIRDHPRPTVEPVVRPPTPPLPASMPWASRTAHPVPFPRAPRPDAEATAPNTTGAGARGRARPRASSKKPRRTPGRFAGRARAQTKQLVRWLTNIGARTLDPTTEGPRFRGRVHRIIDAIPDRDTQRRKKERLDLLLGTDPTAEALVPYINGLRAELLGEEVP